MPLVTRDPCQCRLYCFFSLLFPNVLFGGRWLYIKYTAGHTRTVPVRAGEKTERCGARNRHPVRSKNSSVYIYQGEEEEGEALFGRLYSIRIITAKKYKEIKKQQQHDRAVTLFAHFLLHTPKYRVKWRDQTDGKNLSGPIWVSHVSSHQSENNKSSCHVITSPHKTMKCDHFLLCKRRNRMKVTFLSLFFFVNPSLLPCLSFWRREKHTCTSRTIICRWRDSRPTVCCAFAVQKRFLHRTTQA